MSEKMREEFEVAYRKNFGREPGRWDSDVEKYIDSHTAGAWWGYRTATPRAFGDGWIAAMTWEKKDGCNE